MALTCPRMSVVVCFPETGWMMSLAWKSYVKHEVSGDRDDMMINRKFVSTSHSMLNILSFTRAALT